MDDVGAEVDDAFGEWDERAAVAAGSQPAVLPAASRAATRSDPLTTGVLAEVTRRSRPPEAARGSGTLEVPRVRRTMEVPAASLEEALRAFTEDVASAEAACEAGGAGAAAHDERAARPAYRAAR